MLTDTYREAFHWYYRLGVPAYQAAAFARYRLTHQSSGPGVGDFAYTPAAREQMRVTGDRTRTWVPINPLYDEQKADRIGWPSAGEFYS